VSYTPGFADELKNGSSEICGKEEGKKAILGKKKKMKGSGKRPRRASADEGLLKETDKRTAIPSI